MKLHMPVPRLLPFTIAAMAVVLAVKTVDLARYAVSSFNDVSSGGVVSVARAAVPDKPPAATPVSTAPAPTTTGATMPVSMTSVATTPAPMAPAHASPSDSAGPPPVSDSERAILLELRQRRQELDGRDATLAVRESVLAAAEQKIASRVEELGALQKRLQELESARQQREEGGWQGLVKLYEAMKPRDAAVIFNDLQMPVLLPLVDRMKEAKAASVLAAMNPDKARDVTSGLAQMRTHRETTSGPAQQGG